MDPREQRGIVIAAMCRIERQNGAWLVPSQSSAERRYEVRLDGEGSCTCPDHRESGFCCKHIRAVRIVVRRETHMDGSITETKSITIEEKRTTYAQPWAQYNLSQIIEKHRLQVLLFDLCRTLPDAEHKKRGPKPHRIRDCVFAMAFKVYCGLSSRRFSTDLRETNKGGFLTRPIPGPKVTAFFENPVFTPILIDLIQKSAIPLRVVDTTFAVDSSGFSSSRYETWWDHKYGVERRKCAWVKVHVACGTKTNVITAVRILDKDAGDAPQFPPLVKTTAERFTVNEVSADKAYLSEENVEVVFQLGATPFILPKVNTTGGLGGLFEKMVRYFQFRQEEFLAHYHKRSNVESLFSSVKRKFGDSVMSKTDTAMVNEVLCKLLCHNICTLIQEQCILGIEPVFWPAETPESERNELRLAATN